MDRNALGVLVGACGSGLGFGGQSWECVLGFARLGLAKGIKLASGFKLLVGWHGLRVTAIPMGAGGRGLWSRCWACFVQGPSQPMQLLFLFL